MSLILLHGGMKERPCFPASIVWLWTILASQVCLNSQASIHSFIYSTSFLATSVDVERAFSQGRLLLSHVRSRLSVQSTRALMCLGAWSLRGFVKDSDVQAVTILPGLAPNTPEDELEADWDAIVE